jgi:hypothetical protein
VLFEVFHVGTLFLEVFDVETLFLEVFDVGTLGGTTEKKGVK